MGIFNQERRFSKHSIQEVQNYWNNRPCNLKHSRKDTNTKEYFDEVEARKYFVEPNLLKFADFSSVKGKKVLEIGCGLGTTTIGFARAGAKKVTAVDVSERSLEMAKKNAELRGFGDKIEFYHANAEKLADYIPDEQYDLIFSFGVIHHSPHPGLILEQMRKLLKPEGQVKIMVYHRYSWKVLWILVKYARLKFWKLSENIAKYSEAQTGCPITYAYSRRTGKRLLESKGFKVNTTQVDHIFPYRISDYVEYRYVKIWYFRYLPKPVFRLLQTCLGWHLCFTATKAKA